MSPLPTETASQIGSRDPFQNGTGMRFNLAPPYLFSDLQAPASRHSRCVSKGMSFWLILLAVQAAVMMFALVRESGKDTRFEGEKLGFRS